MSGSIASTAGRLAQAWLERRPEDQAGFERVTEQVLGGARSEHAKIVAQALSYVDAATTSAGAYWTFAQKLTSPLGVVQGLEEALRLAPESNDPVAQGAVRLGQLSHLARKALTASNAFWERPADALKQEAFEQSIDRLNLGVSPGIGHVEDLAWPGSAIGKIEEWLRSLRDPRNAGNRDKIAQRLEETLDELTSAPPSDKALLAKENKAKAADFDARHRDWIEVPQLTFWALFKTPRATEGLPVAILAPDETGALVELRGRCSGASSELRIGEPGANLIIDLEQPFLGQLTFELDANSLIGPRPPPHVRLDCHPTVTENVFTVAATEAGMVGVSTPLPTALGLMPGIGAGATALLGREVLVRTPAPELHDWRLLRGQVVEADPRTCLFKLRTAAGQVHALDYLDHGFSIATPLQATAQLALLERELKRDGFVTKDRSRWHREFGRSLGPLWGNQAVAVIPNPETHQLDVVRGKILPGTQNSGEDYQLLSREGRWVPIDHDGVFRLAVLHPPKPER